MKTKKIKIYSIIYYNDNNEKYYTIKSDISRHITSDEWIVNDGELCILIVKDFLDVPEKPLTIKQIKSDFSSSEYPLDSEKIKRIKDYYNGRYKIFKSFLKKFESDKYTELKIEIPEKCNIFALDEQFNIKQNYSYILIKQYV